MSRTAARTVILTLSLLACLTGMAWAGEDPIVERGVRIPLPGGSHLAADIVRPAGKGQFPTIYVHTCYGRKHVSSVAPEFPFRAELTARHRYAYVATDWRGYPPPPGQSVDKRIDVGKDGAAAVEWIASRPWSNGKVGIWGHSAVAGAAFKVMRERPRHLVCAVPASGTDGLRYGQFFYGGVLEKQHWDIGTRVGHHVLEPLLRRNTYDWLWQWIDRARKPFPSRIPTLLITGWFDTNPSLKLAMFDELKTAYGDDSARVKLLAGPWQHTAFGKTRQGGVEFPEAKGTTGEATLRFFDHYLRGEKNGWDERSAVTYFVMGRNEWRTAARWPLETEARVLRLTGDGGLSTEPPKKPATIEWTHDPAKPVPTTGGASILEVKWLRTKAGPYDLRPILERPDVNCFTSARLAKELVVVGRARAVLHVSSDQVDTDIALWLADVDPGGRSVLVADGILRLSFRDSASRPRPLKPGIVHEVTVTLTPTAVAFREGHRIRLVVASSNYPRFDRHPVKARNTLHLGPAQVSRLELPVPTSPPPIPPGLHERKIQVGTIDRHYLVHVPPADAGREPRPVVLMFHGGGGTATAALRETGWTKMADEKGFLVVLPEGTRPDPSRPARFVGNPQTWNDGSNRGGVGAVGRGVDDVEFVRRLVEDIQTRFPVDPRRIYATGFSNGASMAFRTGRELSPTFTAIAPVAGSDWTAATGRGPLPRLLYITGAADPLNPIDGGEIRIGRKSYGMKPPVADMIRKWKKLIGDEKVRLVTVEWLGHHWPGGKSLLPESLAGRKSDAVDATRLIWEFFAQP